MHLRPVIAIAALGACSSKPQAVPPKPPNNELIVGVYERRPPASVQVVGFGNDGSFQFAKTDAELDTAPIANGTFKLDGDELTFTSVKGQCAGSDGERDGVYKIVISRVGIRFVKVSDGCDARSRLDGQTWWRK